MEIWVATKLALRNYATFTGRTSRPDYWYFVLALLLVSTIASVLSDDLATVVAIATLMPWLSAKVESVVNRFSEKLKMYQLLGLESLDQDWVLVSEQDYDWWSQYRFGQDASYPLTLWDQDLKELGHCVLSANVFCGAGSEVNEVNYQDNVVGTQFTDRGIDYVARHEATHFYQAVFGYGGKCWMAEGQATFFETYLEPSARSRSQVVRSLLASPTGVAKASEAELFALIDSNMVCEGDPNIAYDMGMLAFEHLYMNFSLLQLHDLLVLSSDSRWEAAVSEALGVEAEQLNRDLAAYIFSQLS